MTMKSVSSVAALVVVLCCSCCCFLAAVAAAPYQVLMPRPGYVPVYIRVGDTPLADIDPRLAAAFNEIDVSNSMLEDAPEMIMPSAAGKDDNDGAAVDQVMAAGEQEALVITPNQSSFFNNKTDREVDVMANKKITDRKAQDEPLPIIHGLVKISNGTIIT